MKTMRWIPFVILFVFAVPGLDCLSDLSFERQEDFSDFQAFEFSEGPGMFFCPELPFYQARVSRQDDGGYAVTFAVIEQGQSGADDCREDLISEDCRFGEAYGSEADAWSGWDWSVAGATWSEYLPDDADLDPVAFEDDCNCPVVRELSPRRLSDAEAVRMLNAFEQVVIHTTFYDACLDHCLIDTFRWDGFEISTPTSCMTGFADWLDGDSSSAIKDVLRDLYDASQAGL